MNIINISRILCAIFGQRYEVFISPQTCIFVIFVIFLETLIFSLNKPNGLWLLNKILSSINEKSDFYGEHGRI